MSNREKEWLELMNKYNDFFYADDGIFIEFLMDNELEKYNWDFERIKNLIKSLKEFEEKYGKLNEIEENNLKEKKDILMNMKTDTNGIEEYYTKMQKMYYAVDSY